MEGVTLLPMVSCTPILTRRGYYWYIQIKYPVLNKFVRQRRRGTDVCQTIPTYIILTYCSTYIG
jgi:hypothetical protein